MSDEGVIPVWAEIIDQMIVGTDAATAPLLLRQAALSAVYRRAGMVTPVSKTSVDLKPAPPETLKACAVREATEMLRYEREVPMNLLIPLWLTVLYRKQKRIPHKLLPQFLTLGKTSRHFVPYILRVLGERGRWMIEGSEDFDYMKQQILLPEEDSVLIARSLEDWKQHPLYLTWHDTVLPHNKERLETQFAERYQTIMEGFPR